MRLGCPIIFWKMSWPLIWHWISLLNRVFHSLNIFLPCLFFLTGRKKNTVYHHAQVNHTINLLSILICRVLLNKVTLYKFTCIMPLLHMYTYHLKSITYKRLPSESSPLPRLFTWEAFSLNSYPPLWQQKTHFKLKLNN